LGSATATLNNSTLSGNSAVTDGGGIFNNGNGAAATLVLTNTILNTGGASGENIYNFGGVVTSHGYNLSSDAGVTNAAGGTGNLTAMGDQTGTDPMLGPLQNNGGPTFTHAIDCDSPAVDRGKNFAGATTDQRGPGFNRTVGFAAAQDGDGTDIGAFEVQTVCNTPPIITGATISRQQGAASSNSQIATVSDVDQSPNTLTVTVNGGASATVNGVTVSNLVIDGSGNVTADVVAGCSASQAGFTLGATDNDGLVNEDTLTVNVSANTAPTLTYNAASVANGGSTSINPAAGPSDNVSVASVVLQSQGTYTGTISVSGAGVVSISHAGPGGSHTITIRATDNCGVATDATFTLDVGAPISAQALNISTRLLVDTGDKVMIGGFIIRGNASKPVVLRGLGPSLANANVPAASVLSDPMLELRGPNGALIMSNDNWKESPQRSQIEDTAFQPGDDREAVILTTLVPGNYTAVLSGVGGTAGVGIVEVYDNDQTIDSDLANISTRGFVQTGDEVMIGGFTLGGNNNATPRMAIRGLGPSLTSSGLSNVLADPTLELHDANGSTLIANDDWQSDPAAAGELSANGLALPDPKESGLFVSLSAGQFTAILAGKNGGVGIGLVEIYNLR
jgi:hypothetical protein